MSHKRIAFIAPFSGVLFSCVLLLQGCQSLPPDRPSPSGRMCATIFENGTHRFLGRGYDSKKKHNAGFLWMTLKPVEKLADGTYELKAKVRSFFGPRLYHSIQFTRGQCVDLPDRHFSVILLESENNSSFSLWFWGEDGMPQHDDRLMGYASFSGTKVYNSKVALWYR